MTHTKPKAPSWLPGLGPGPGLLGVERGLTPAQARMAELVVFLGGACGLVYELLWMRMLVLVFGGTTYAVGIVLAVFMGGLALGSAWLGAQADRSSNPLRAYGMLEVSVGLYALITPWLFHGVEAARAALAAGTDGSGLGATAVLAAAVLLPPTVLLGATFPFLVRAFAGGRGPGPAAARVYALNTSGAVAGTLAAGFVLIPGLGVHGTLVAAVAADLALGLGAAALSGSLCPATAQVPEPEQAPVGWVLALAASAGAVALALETFWTRQMAQVLGSSVYAFTAILAAFLVGIAAGGWLAGRLSSRRPLEVFGWLQLGAAAAVTGASLALSWLPFAFLHLFAWTGGSFSALQLGQILLVLVLLLPPAALLGAGLPVLFSAAASEPRWGGRIGLIYGANTLGAAAGAMLAAFWVVPAFGAQAGVRAAAAAAAAAGAFALLRSGAAPRAWAAAGVLALAALLVPAPSLKVLSSGVPVYAKGFIERGRGAAEWRLMMEERELAFFRDGLNASVAVWKGPGEALSLAVNGKVDASNNPGGDMEIQLLLGHLPVLLSESASRGGTVVPERVLMIGLGSGITLGALARHPIGRIDCVEIEPAVVEASRYFEAYNRLALDDPRVRLTVADGRQVLAASLARYPLIVSAPSNPWITGVSNLFTRDYYELAASRLAPGGIFAQWFQLYSMDLEDLRSQLATFRSVFPEAQLWQEGKNLVLVGALQPLKLGGGRLRAALARAEYREEALPLTPEGVLARFVMGSEGMEAAGRGAPANTDDRPVIEFSAPRSLYRDETAAANLAFLEGRREAVSARVAGLGSTEPLVRELLRGGHPGAAALELELLAAARPSDAALRRELGEAWLGAGRPERATPHFERLASRGAGAEAFLDLARAAWEAGDAGRTRAALARVAALAGPKADGLEAALADGKARGYLRLGQAYAGLGRRETAARMMERALALDPKVLDEMLKPKAGR